MVRCDICGTKNRVGARNCGKCGSLLVGTVAVEHAIHTGLAIRLRHPRMLILLVLIAFIVAATPALVSYLNNNSRISTPGSIGSHGGSTSDFQLNWVSSGQVTVSSNPLEASLSVPVCSSTYEVTVSLQVVPLVGTPHVQLDVQGTPGSPGMQTFTKDPFWASHVVEISGGPSRPDWTAPLIYTMQLYFNRLTPSMAGSTDQIEPNGGLTVIGQSATSTQYAVLYIHYVSC